MSHHILVVDNDPVQCKTLELAIKNMLGYEVSIATSGQEAIDILSSNKSEEIDLVILDLSMPEIDGMDVLNAVCPKLPDLPIIIYTAHGDLEKAVEAIKIGAVDFVEKQDDPERIKISINNALKIKSLKSEVSRLKRSVEGQVQFSDICGCSKEINATKEIAEQGAKSSIPVLIKGESGVGKELFARAIHGSSDRANKPFISVNCGAIPENLVESTLFGHEKGSFTGAIAKSLGKFREADGGTLFLDEIGELKPDIQVKLLRAIQEKEVEPVGAGAPVNVDIRLISATNRNLKQDVKDGKFREDLYYRLNVFPVTIPPLRDRSKDIELLLDYFYKRIAASEGKDIKDFSEKAKKILSTYHWPGNVRQLENAVYRAVVLCENDHLDVENFSQIINSISQFNDITNPEASQQSTGGLLRLINGSDDFKTFDEIEEEIIREALDFYNWRITEVSRKLKIGRSTLYRKISEFNIKDPSESNAESIN